MKLTKLPEQLGGYLGDLVLREDLVGVRQSVKVMSILIYVLTYKIDMIFVNQAFHRL